MAQAQVLIRGGRVIDPATGEDRVADVLVEDGAIRAVAPDLPAEGAREIDARGLIVGPGFVDLHSHASSPDGMRLRALDGATTSLELEAGAMPAAVAYERTAAEGRPINFGFSASWGAARAQVLAGVPADGTPGGVLAVIGDPAWQRSSSPRELAAWLDLLDGELAAGALGIGNLVGYAPRTDPAEYLAVARLAAEAGAPVFTHVRELVEDDPSTPVDGPDELIGAAAETGAHMHHCHVNSTARRNVARVLDGIDRARAAGLPVTVEAYPYGAGSTGVGAAFLAPENLRRWGLTPSSIVMAATGERIADAARLRELRATDPDSACIVEFLEEGDPLLALPLAHPDVMVASDAMPGATHPRSAGTFARAIRLNVREGGDWTWVEAFRRCSLLPARVLDAVAPAARAKGHLGAGADADIVVLDPATISDRATFADPGRPSTGVRHLLVHGEAVIRDGALLPDALPGRPLRGAPR